MSEEIKQITFKEVYPCTIVMDRYNGSYSNAKWLAFNLNDTDIPDEIGASDPDESNFWHEHDNKNFPIGKGKTPDLAYIDLARLIWERDNNTEDANIVDQKMVPDSLTWDYSYKPNIIEKLDEPEPEYEYQIEVKFPPRNDDHLSQDIKDIFMSQEEKDARELSDKMATHIRKSFGINEPE